VPEDSIERVRATLRGAVQGVGFRPLVYRIATQTGVYGWVLNSSGGLVLEAEGGRGKLTRFLERLEAERPAAAVVTSRELEHLAPAGYTRFEIRFSEAEEARTTGVQADLATCADCLREVSDPADRRHGYPFTNCTHCGPRYTIVREIPYDRANTTMRDFRLCEACAAEYRNPLDRRFHAQPVACPECGPRLEGSIEEVVRALGGGLIVALKGVGGFQLLVDARNEEAVDRLRKAKRREEKPFALMMPSLEAARRYAVVSEEEAAVLRSTASPIVLLTPNPGTDLARNVAESSPFVGVMLPYSPLHHLLLTALGYPVVATSGNVSDEPICIDNGEARERLGGIADYFLMHDRPIARPCDDSVARVLRGRRGVIRRARGYAPLPVAVGEAMRPVLAVGGHLKNTVAIGVTDQVVLSQHIGDLDTSEARRSFVNAIDDLCRLYRFQPRAIACDLHPDYASTLWARESGLPLVMVQHHQAHAAACAAEHKLHGPFLGVSWDGTGYGLDGAIWGGEFFLAEKGGMERVAHIRPFRLPGGEAAIKETMRPAAGLLWELEGQGGVQNAVLRQMLARGVNSPLTTSVGRLFDAVAWLTATAARNSFEGQAAMQLERRASLVSTEDAYGLPGGDWAGLVEELRADLARGIDRCLAAAKFHNALANWILEVARRVAVENVVLSGGVFQNAYLTGRAARLLEEGGFRVFTHEQVPPNDGGIALGQAVLAGRE
jgi:hydrogenase maturation protein HypF